MRNYAILFLLFYCGFVQASESGKNYADKFLAALDVHGDQQKGGALRVLFNEHRGNFAAQFTEKACDEQFNVDRLEPALIAGGFTTDDCSALRTAVIVGIIERLRAEDNN